MTNIGDRSNDTTRIGAILQHWEGPFDRAIAGLQTEVVRIRRHLHAHPEPSGEEVETTRFLQAKLQQAGIETRRYRSDAQRETGLTADVSLGSPAENCPMIAIRSDIDALRIPDQKDVEYRSQNAGVAHACGHDAHASIVAGLALAAAKLSRELSAEGDLPGLRLRFLFQPAEETSGGARWLVDQGAMDGVDAVLGLHVDPERPVGEVGVRYGVLTAFCDEVDFAVRGQGGHSARPHHTVDPIAAAAQLVAALYQSLPRSVDSRDASVFSVGQIEGGYAPNVIPGEVRLRGSLRTTDALTRTTLQRRIREICHGIGETTAAKVEVLFGAPLGAVDNHPVLAAALELASRRVVGEDGTKLIDRPSLGGEDFSVYLERAPGALLRLGCAGGAGRQPFLHSPLFDVDERCLAIGMRVLILAAILVAADPDVLRKDIA